MEVLLNHSEYRLIWYQGYDDYLEGKSVTMNPYPEEDEPMKWHAWENGWRDAAWDD